MADKKPTTRSAEIVAALFGMPRVEIPQDATLDDLGYVVFALETALGPIHVKAYWNEFNCRGTADALIAARLARAEWFPGLLGNQKSRQVILFDSTGPTVLKGGLKNKKKPTQPYITVCRASPRNFVVEMPATPDQCKRLKVFHEQREARAKAKDDAKFWERYDERKRELYRSQTPEGLRNDTCRVLELFDDVFAKGTEGIGVHYAADVIAEVRAHSNAIRQALLSGKILPAAQQYQCIGNVAFWPGVAG